MSYNKQNFIKGQILKADHLNAMDAGIEANDLAIAALSEEMDALEAEIEAMKDGGGTVDEIVAVTYSTNGFVSAVTNELASHASYQVSDVIELHAGDTISFESSVPDGAYVWVLSKWDKDGNTLVSGLIKGTSEVQTVRYTAKNASEYVRISQWTRTGHPQVPAVTISRPINQEQNQLDALTAEIESLKTAVSDCVPFVRIGVIGDSLASGASNYTNASGTGIGTDRPNYSWGKYMEREHGVEVELFTQGGTSTQTWLTRPIGLAAMQAADACDCYIIGLGVNDKASLGMDYLGTSGDVTVGNENSNADSFYGNYSKIIASLIEKSPRCKIFCLTMPSEQGEAAIAFNVAIRDLVGMYDNAHLIDIENDEFFSSAHFRDTWYVAHSTAVGYKSIAGHLWKLMNEYIMQNVSSFTDVQWILENHG